MSLAKSTIATVGSGVMADAMIAGLLRERESGRLRTKLSEAPSMGDES